MECEQKNQLELIVNAIEIREQLLHRLCARFYLFNEKEVANYYHSLWRGSRGVSSIQYARENPEHRDAFSNYLFGKAFTNYFRAIKDLDPVHDNVRRMTNGFK